MNFRSLLVLPLAGGLLLAGQVLAQGQPAISDTSSTTFNTPQGQVTIDSKPAAAPAVGSAPDFAALSGGKKWITRAQAASYPPLANDFGFADSNHDGHISKAEYARWVKQLN
ncbi:hypothetical protein [Dyella sp. A6]|uniref:hypothetical protein n=1 Tax=Dyella aluminiiresistens TaxID=3069105 RepID=UPI002E75B58C|nr:hypothetical protein [Dyella sp. A6]